ALLTLEVGSKNKITSSSKSLSSFLESFRKISSKGYFTLPGGLVPTKIVCETNSGNSVVTIWATQPPNDQPPTMIFLKPNASARSTTSFAKRCMLVGASPVEDAKPV